MTNTKSVVVTGVSTGIGHAITSALIGRGYIVYGSVRKESDAQKLTSEFGEALRPLIFDVTDEDAITAAAEKVARELEGRTLAGLVNNAGIAVAGPVASIPLDEIKHQFDVNVFGPIRVTQAFLPLLGTDRARKGNPGKIVNMSSVAGKIASPFMSPYAMSKHALEAYTEAARRELSLFGIDAVAVGPGAIKTPIWDKADEINVEQYKDTPYAEYLQGMKDMMQDFGKEGLPPEAVGSLVADILDGQETKTRYAILRNKFIMWTLPRLLPARVFDRIITKRFGLSDKS